MTKKKKILKDEQYSIIFATNKRLNYDYKIKKKYEAGACLRGSEVKAIRNRNLSISSAYATVTNNPTKSKKNKLFIAVYNIRLGNKTFTRQNKKKTLNLLLNRHEIESLDMHIKRKAYTAVISKVYSLGNKIKFEVCLAKGQKKYEKRERQRKKEEQRKQKNWLNVDSEE